MTRTPVALIGEPRSGKPQLLHEPVRPAHEHRQGAVLGRGTEVEQRVFFGPAIDALYEWILSLEVSRLNPLGPEQLVQLASALPLLAGLAADTATAYDAGIFDGEGNVGIVGPTPSEPHRYQLRVTIAMTHRPTIEHLNRRWRGEAAPVHRFKPRNPRHAARYEFRLCSRRAVDFLEAVRPFAITKAEAIDVALDFPRASTASEREKVRLRLREVNRRGPR
jgi:hypothetical protein